MSADLPEPLDGPEYNEVVELVMLAAHIDGPISSAIAARLVATIQATRDLVDELRVAGGLDDLIRHDFESRKA